MPGDSLQVNINNKGVSQNTFDAIVIGTQNPSLIFMAMTARAAGHAVEELKKINI